MVGKKHFPGRRRLSITLRTLHLIGVVLAGVGIFGSGANATAGVVLMLLTGFGLYAIELLHNPGFWREVAGLLTPVKLIILGAMLVVPAMAGPLFWLVLIASSAVSHAPYEFRHRKIVP